MQFGSNFTARPAPLLSWCAHGDPCREDSLHRRRAEAHCNARSYSAWLQVQSCILKTVAEAKHCLFTLPEVKYRKAELRGCRVLESGHADGRQPFEQHHPLNETIGTSHAF